MRSNTSLKIYIKDVKTVLILILLQAMLIMDFNYPGYLINQIYFEHCKHYRALFIFTQYHIGK